MMDYTQGSVSPLQLKKLVFTTENGVAGTLQYFSCSFQRKHFLNDNQHASVTPRSIYLFISYFIHWVTSNHW